MMAQICPTFPIGNNVTNITNLTFHREGRQEPYTTNARNVSLICTFAAERLDLYCVCRSSVYSLVVTNPPSVGLCPL